jgi:hypothetical protein
MLASKSVYTGVDYARFTAVDHRPFDHWRAILEPEWVREELAGRKPHQRVLLGYFGRVGEHCFLGKNDTGCMVQASGAFAWERWHELGNYSERCTRMDLQVTWPIDGEPGEYIREMYGVAVLHKTRGHRGQEAQIVDTPSGAKMLTIGSRQSEVYGRMYDKGRESGIPDYKGCVRWEIEVKGQQARDLNSYMREHRNESNQTRAIVKQYWEARGMTPFWDTFEASETKPPVKRTRTDETKLAWLATQVRPTLQKLKESGKLQQAIAVMFDGVLTEAQVRAIVLSSEVDEGV